MKIIKITLFYYIDSTCPKKHNRCPRLERNPVSLRIIEVSKSFIARRGLYSRDKI